MSEKRGEVWIHCIPKPPLFLLWCYNCILPFCSALLTACLENAKFDVESVIQLTQGWKKEIVVTLKGTCIFIKPLFYFIFMYFVFKLFCISSCFICEVCIISCAFWCDL